MFALLLALSTEVKYVYADENGREFVYEYVEEEAKPQYVYADESGREFIYEYVYDDKAPRTQYVYEDEEGKEFIYVYVEDEANYGFKPLDPAEDDLDYQYVYADENGREFIYIYVESNDQEFEFDTNSKYVYAYEDPDEDQNAAPNAQSNNLVSDHVKLSKHKFSKTHGRKPHANRQIGKKVFITRHLSSSEVTNGALVGTRTDLV